MDTTSTQMNKLSSTRPNLANVRGNIGVDNMLVIEAVFSLNGTISNFTRTFSEHSRWEVAWVRKNKRATIQFLQNFNQFYQENRETLKPFLFDLLSIGGKWKEIG